MTGVGVEHQVIDIAGAGGEIPCTVRTSGELIMVEAWVGDEFAVDDTGIVHGRSLLRDWRGQVIKDSGSSCEIGGSKIYSASRRRSAPAAKSILRGPQQYF